MDRTKIAGIVLSAMALITIAAHEGYRDTAYIPVTGDVPTIGFGSTTNLDSTSVRMNQRTTPVAALKRLGEDVKVFEEAVKRCAPVPMYQHEFDA